ncbi:MAG: glycosyltransferase [Lachnospiraceae bacterium]|nr:glycosyltransferase [Lachnospiraceae bacterium]
MSIPIITVIVPVHNEEEYIDRLMESLQVQTYRRLQVILIDGGSTDSTPARIDAWASKWNMGPDSNMGIVEVIHTSDKGVSASRNIGLNHASGDLITFVDGDDWLEKDALERMYRCMQESGADLVGMDFESIYPDTSGSETEQGDGGSRYTEYSPAEFQSEHILRGDVHVWGRLYRSSRIGRLRFREGLTIGEDMLFVSEYAACCVRIAHMEYRGYNYFRNPAGAMGRPFTSAAMDQVRCFRLEQELLGNIAPELADSDELKSNMLISVMLTAGRIAFLDKEIRKDEEHKGYIRELRSTIKEYKSRGAMKLLDRGYRIKVRLFRALPGLYLALYHTHRPK